MIYILRSYPTGEWLLLGKEWAEATTVPLGPNTMKSLFFVVVVFSLLLFFKSLFLER